MRWMLVFAIAFVLPGCGSAVPSAAIPNTYTAPTTKTFTKARTGELIRCTNHGASIGAHVPPPGKGVGGAADGTTASAELELNRSPNGSLQVSCKP